MSVIVRTTVDAQKTELTTEQVRELAGHASIGEPVCIRSTLEPAQGETNAHWVGEPREAIPELEPDYDSPAFQAGVAIWRSIDPEILAKLQFVRDTLDNGHA